MIAIKAYSYSKESRPNSVDVIPSYKNKNNLMVQTCKQDSGHAQIHLYLPFPLLNHANLKSASTKKINNIHNLHICKTVSLYWKFGTNQGRMEDAGQEKLEEIKVAERWG
jgi:hypothetical protein